MNRDTLTATLIWITLTATGEVLILLWDIFPVAASREAEITDDAFLLLTVLAIPIFALVVVIIGYSVWKFRRKDSDTSDAEYVRTHDGWVKSWLVWTTALTIGIIIVPGYSGLLDLRATEDDPADLVINVQGQQWFWQYEYEGLDVTLIDVGQTRELVLPVDSLIRFNVTAHPEDVLHSFWIPAFRIKIDAVPGLMTRVDTTTTETGDFNDDDSFRVQCAELCGINHSTMFTRVRVVEQAEFDAWVAANAS